MSRDFDAWVIFVAAAATLAVLLQLGFVVALLFGIRTLSAKIREMRAKSGSGGPALRDLVTTARDTLDHINRVAKDTAELTERIKPVVQQAADVSHRQLTGEISPYDGNPVRIHTRPLVSPARRPDDLPALERRQHAFVESQLR